MKKFLYVLTAVMTIAAGLALTGCNNDVYTGTTLDFNANEVSEISVSLENRRVEVVSYDGEDILFEGFVSEKEYYSTSLTDGVLSISSAYDKTAADYIGLGTPDEYKSVRISLPQGMVDRISVSTTDENITISNIVVKDSVALSVNNGDINFDTVDAQNIDIKAKNGNITGSLSGQIGDYTISVTQKKGESNLPASLSGGDRRLYIDSNNGDVNISFR